MAYASSRTWIPPTRAGVARTLASMVGMAREADPRVHRWAHAIAAEARVMAQPFPRRLRTWIASRWRETADPYGVELVYSPAYQLERLEARGYLEGDCDDAAVLAAALALANGYRARYVAVGVTDIPEHTYAEVAAPGPEPAWETIDVLRPVGDALSWRSGMVVNL